jgi:hypothetical protein
VELVEEEDGMRLPIGVEDPVDGHPQIVGSGMSVLHGEVEDRVINEAGEPAMNAALRTVPL